MKRFAALTGVSLLVALGLLCPRGAMAQSATTGALTGTVRSPQGEVIPGATVVLVNTATNQSQSTTTTAGGSYQFSLLPPGSYEVRFSLQGFKTSVVNQVAVDVSETPTLDAQMVPGDTAETVECVCVISESTTSSGTLVDQKTITAVPLNTRNFTQVLSMSSGSAADVNNAGTLGRGNQNVNVNGNTTAGSYTIDGAYASSTVPNPDTISEFKIQTSQYDAGYGAQVPSTNLITKSGENDIHGDIWEFLRNDIFNANAFFRNATSQPKPNLKQNQYGATVGGPVIKDKWFYFGSYQGTRQVNGLDPTSVATTLLPPLTEDRSASTLAAQFCPANHILAGGAADPRYISFAGGKQLDCNNQNTATTAGINPVALRILQAKGPDGQYLIPVPQTILTTGPNAGVGFSSYSFPSTYKEHQFLANSDYVVSPKHTVSFRGFFSTLDQYRSLGAPGGATVTPVIPGAGAPQALTARDYVVSIKVASVLTRNLVNEARMTYTRNNSVAIGVGTPAASEFGMTPVDPLFPQPPEVTMLGAMGTFRFFGNGANDFSNSTDVYSWADNLSWTHGKHSVRTGGFLFRHGFDRLDTGAARGKITFLTFQDFLLGLNAADNGSPFGRSNIQTVQANEGVGPNGEVQYLYRRFYGSAFVQDDIRVKPGLTVNLGIRWEYVGAPTDAAGTIGNFLPSLLNQSGVPPVGGTLAGNTLAGNYNPNFINPYTNQPFGPPPAGVVIRSGNSFYTNSTPKDTFAPRVSFAWQPFGTQGRISTRGGYGWFYSAPPISGNASGTPMFTAPPFAQGFTNADVANNLSSWGQPFPTTTLGYVPRTPTSQLSDRVAGPEYKIPRLQQWNFNIQTRISSKLSFDLGYVGSYGDKLLLARGLNQPLLASPDNPVNCGYNGNPGDCITTNTSVNARLRVPVMGEVPTALLSHEFIGESWYQSLQATFRQQLSHGLTFQAAYTLSRASNNTSIYNDLTNLALNRARATFDRRHRIITNFDYQIPSLFGRGFGGALFGGWSMAGIVIIQSGTPLTLTDPRGGGVYGRASQSTVTLCPDAGTVGLATSGDTISRLNNWVNTAAICNPPVVGADGSTGYGNAGQGIMSGPGQVNTDFSVGKRTRVGGLREDAELAFRVEFYNALNHSQFANPGTTFGTANFGVITQTSVAPRLIQFGLKYLF